MTKYTIARDETILGEFNAQELSDLYHAGKLLPTDLLYQIGFRDWIILQDAMILIAETPPTNATVQDTPSHPDNSAGPPIISSSQAPPVISPSNDHDRPQTVTSLNCDDFYFETIEVSELKSTLSVSSSEDQLHFIQRSGNTLTVQLRDGSSESFSFGEYETFSEKNGHDMRYNTVRDLKNKKRRIRFVEVLYAAPLDWPESGFKAYFNGDLTTEAEAWWGEIYKRVGFEETKLSKVGGVLGKLPI